MPDYHLDNAQSMKLNTQYAHVYLMSIYCLFLIINMNQSWLIVVFKKYVYTNFPT